MKDKKQAEDSIQHLFVHPENQYNFELLYKYLSQGESHEGFLLCKGMPAERNRLLSFFRDDSVMKRIQFIDMANPVIDTVDLQETIAAVHEKKANKKDIFFIYNIEDCIERLKVAERDFFGRLNLIRDFFMRYSSVFVFFMTEWLVKEMIRFAFDFYDWIKLTFTFIPEDEERRLFQMEPGIAQKYSNPHEKIEYLKTQIEKVNDPQRRFPLLKDMGMLYYQLGNFDLAFQYTIEALDILEMSTGKRTDDLADMYNNLSVIYLDMGQIEKALEFQLKALAIREQVLEKNHPTLATSYNNLSGIYQGMGQIEKALEFQLKALAIRERVLEKNHPTLATSFNNLSLIYQVMGQVEKALEFQLKALNIRERLLEKDHPSLANSYNNLSTIYQAMGHVDKALSFAEKAVGILTHIFPNGHPNLTKAKENLELIKKMRHLPH